MKKLLLVTDTYPPDINGVARWAEEMAQRLPGKGVEVAVAHPRLFWHVPMPFYPELAVALSAARPFARMLERERPDFVHIADEGPLGLSARRVCVSRGVPFTTSYHTRFDMYAGMRVPGVGPLARAYLRRFHRPSAAVFAATPSLCETLQAERFARVVLVPFGIDTEFFTRDPRPTVPELPEPVFAFFGRVVVEKSPEEFLSLPLPGTKLVIGDGPARMRLERRYGDAAKFIGYRKGGELVEWLSRVDVLVMPSRTETFGLVIAEALACGIPCAAYDVMGPKDIITDGTDGILAKDGDLAKAARACLSLSREACREKALRYSWDESLDAFVGHLVPLSGGAREASHAGAR
ncbi:MAG: glycosyltransferase family 1 protein [Patescibacteria group bacterium]|nr:glycosyltransferase family 1 protein [Patescibacteria group bacterium]MDE1966037.1 glycosyltransferase family 1 protein [Patescibacteria group bacterium]